MKGKDKLKSKEELVLLEALVDKLSDSVQIVDEDGDFLFVNEEAVRRFQRPKEELLEMNVLDIELVFENDINNWKAHVDELKKKGSLFVDGVNVRSDGQEFPVEVNVKYVEINKKGYIVAIARETSERIRTRRALVKAKEDAEKAADSKSEFLSMMSHEIRTPMNAVVGITHLLLEENPNPSQLEHLRTLQFSAENLLGLINDILDFSKIEAGKIDLEEQAFDIVQLLSNIKQSHFLPADERGNKIKLYLDDDCPKIVIGDQVRIGQIITNLVSNGIKFTKDGKVSIEMNLKEKDQKNATIEFIIADTGIGIPEEKQKTIFESFTQATSSTTRKYGGSGLGLAITKNLLHLMGSDIKLESTVGEGAKFIFTLKLGIGESKNEKKKSTPVDLSGFSLDGYQILLVEDNPVNVLVAKKFLTKWGAEVSHAENGQVAVDMLENGIYDVVLMDLQMPIMDGYTATKEIRKFDKSTPIIALTASALIDEKDKAFNLGMNDYLTKPFNPNDLFGKIVKHTPVSKVG